MVMESDTRLRPHWRICASLKGCVEVVPEKSANFACMALCGNREEECRLFGDLDSAVLLSPESSNEVWTSFLVVNLSGHLLQVQISTFHQNAWCKDSVVIFDKEDKFTAGPQGG